MRAYNFAAGPATLPLEVLEQAREELTDWQHLGASVMEISHRGKPFLAMARETESDLRELLAVPANYRVLFMQGGGAAQFSVVPLNLAAADATVDQVVTGHWSKRALDEARRLVRHVNVAADESASNFTTVPAPAALRLSAGAAYVHYCPNETIGGVEFPYVPATGAVPLVADMSSTILSRPIEVAQFGLIYAGAQKNIGPSGLVVVIVREDLLERARADIPAVWSYRNIAAEGSMFNTPPTFSWYLAGLVFKWVKARGGLTAMAERNAAKAARLYAAIDASGFYANPVARACRSWMNVPFTLRDASLEGAFAAEARAAGLINLEGHRSVGGMRASIYNAMPPEGVDALIAFMQDFERRKG
ncbi:MAG TPA: 3-phosphoserine/phosphohydroxythreonine transaminase [Steroidobacteraceae bacterium]|nr:3-phosphoserine/phosphohydroxythreonine transaminase [Steroidobacteraceae bacterium]